MSGGRPDNPDERERVSALLRVEAGARAHPRAHRGPHRHGQVLARAQLPHVLAQGEIHHQHH